MPKRQSGTATARARRPSTSARRAVGGQRCPVCRSRRGVPIVFGLPGPELLEASREGRIHLGGCVVYRENQQWHCQKCGYEWRSSDNLA